jgi:hypothetical protein
MVELRFDGKLRIELGAGAAGGERHHLGQAMIGLGA